MSNSKSAKFAAIWAAAAIALSLVMRPLPLLPLVCGSVAGCFIGVLQGRSLTEGANKFRAAKTALEVRQALKATISGNRAIKLQLLATAIIFLASLWGDHPMGVVPGYFALMCCRDVIALGGLKKLAISAQEAAE